MLEKVARIGSLFELYGVLLTDRQRELVRLYYYDDLSLNEIAQDLGISRQAVFFGLKRSEKVMEEYEKKLGLLRKSSLQRKKLHKILQLLADYRVSGDAEKLDIIHDQLEGFLDFKDGVFF